MNGDPGGAPAGTARDLKHGIERFRLGDRPDVTVLYPDVCFASLEAVGDMPVSLLVDSVLRHWRPEDHLTAPAGGESRAPFPVASLVVSRDTQAGFHPELSNREPVEIQVWADRRVTVEIEFQGVDVTQEPTSWADTIRRVLDAWSGSFGVVLTAVYNDRARSLPDVWNATFYVADQEARVSDLVQMGERASRTAELSMSGWGGEQAVSRLLIDGDVHALLAWQPSAVLEFWPSPPKSEEVDVFVADVCALANSVRGGTIVVGVSQDSSGPSLAPVCRGQLVEDLTTAVERRLYPRPERLDVVFVPVQDSSAADGQPGDSGQVGVVLVRIPPQDDLLRPFLLHTDGAVADGNMMRSVVLVEREGAETISRSVSALHSALATGIAMLRRADPT